MRFEKKLIILTGEGVKCTLKTERNAYGPGAELHVFGVPANERLRLAVFYAHSDLPPAVYLPSYLGRPDRMTFALDSSTDLGRAHFALYAAGRERAIAYGTASGERLPEYSLPILPESHTREEKVYAKHREKTALYGGHPDEAAPNEFDYTTRRDLFLDIFPSGAGYADNAVASVNFYSERNAADNTSADTSAERREPFGEPAEDVGEGVSKEASDGVAEEVAEGACAGVSTEASREEGEGAPAAVAEEAAGEPSEEAFRGTTEEAAGSVADELTRVYDGAGEESKILFGERKEAAEGATAEPRKAKPEKESAGAGKARSEERVREPGAGIAKEHSEKEGKEPGAGVPGTAAEKETRENAGAAQMRERVDERVRSFPARAKRAADERAAAGGIGVRGRRMSYYEQVYDQIESLFKEGKRDRELERLMPHTKWVRVDYSGDGRYYVVGLVGERPDYVCYGVPANFAPAPPDSLGADASWLPLDVTDPHGNGYWVLFQDATTGATVSPER